MLLEDLNTGVFLKVDTTKLRIPVRSSLTINERIIVRLNVKLNSQIALKWRTDQSWQRQNKNSSFCTLDKKKFNIYLVKDLYIAPVKVNISVNVVWME